MTSIPLKVYGAPESLLLQSFCVDISPTMSSEEKGSDITKIQTIFKVSILSCPSVLLF